MAQYVLIQFPDTTICHAKKLPKWHSIALNPDEMAVLGIGTKIATILIMTAFSDRLMSDKKKLGKGTDAFPTIFMPN